MHSKYMIECYCPNVHTDNRKRECISFIIGMSLAIEKSKTDAPEVGMFSSLSFNYERYIFLKCLSNAR